MSEIGKQDPMTTESILQSNGNHSKSRNGTSQDESIIEGSFTSSNSDEYMDEEDGVDMDDDSDEESDDEESDSEDEADDEDDEELMDQDDGGPSTSSGHNTRSSAKKSSPSKANRDTNNSTNGGTKKKSPEKEQDSDPLPFGAESMSESKSGPTTYVPQDGDGLGPDDLEYDESAYIMYHKAECGYPCLSFDIIPDGLGTGETRSSSYPQSVYLVAGTQAPKVHANKLLVMKMSNLNKTKEKKKDADEDSDDSEDEEDKETDPSEEPQLLAAQVPHEGSVNRVRVVRLGNKTVAATWSELGHVFLWDLTKQLTVVEEPKMTEIFNKGRAPPKHLYKFAGHKVEGFAMDWSPMAEGFLATGDCNKNIHVWRPQESFSWKVDKNPLDGHTASVEDIQWSPTEPTVLASCSVDKSIRIWDIRSRPSSACMVTAKDAHSSDINVISWCKKDSTFLLSGGDDGAIKTWDLRMFAPLTKKGTGTTPSPIATFKHHVQPVTSIEWHPNDPTVFAASSDDNQITLWDLAVEKDEEEEDDQLVKGGNGSISGTSSKENDSMEESRLNQLPPQLLFIHQGQNEVKEVHWHPQIDGLVISTALSGFDIFKTVSV